MVLRLNLKKLLEKIFNISYENIHLVGDSTWDLKFANKIKKYCDDGKIVKTHILNAIPKFKPLPKYKRLKFYNPPYKYEIEETYLALVSILKDGKEKQVWKNVDLLKKNPQEFLNFVNIFENVE